MSFSKEQGYIPKSFDDIMQIIMASINSQYNTNYVYQDFIGTNFYRLMYPLVQMYQKNEIKTSEIFFKLQKYIEETNLMISRPASTPNGIMGMIKDKFGFESSIKPMTQPEAGEIRIAIDVDNTKPDYAATRDAINLELSKVIIGGVVCIGTESTTITLDNGQQFDYKFSLPNRVRTYLRLTITTSRNNQIAVEKTQGQIITELLANIKAMYKIGMDFEPEKYWTTSDSFWASDILLEYSDDESSYSSTVENNAYDKLRTFETADVQIILT